VTKKSFVVMNKCISFASFRDIVMSSGMKFPDGNILVYGFDKRHVKTFLV